MDQAIYDLGREEYRRAVGLDEMERDKDGFIILRPTAARVDDRLSTLTTDIGSLEAQLQKFREEKAAAEKYKKTPEYKASKKKGMSKKDKKKRSTLLEMVFNNADAAAESSDEEEDEEGYKDLKKKGSAPKKKETTLDTTYGMRFSPVVSMLYDTITDFDRIAAEIEVELESSRGMTRGMYRASQIGNLISAKNSRLSAVKELGSIAKTVSDLEYKKEKDKQAAEGTNTSKEISNLAAKYLRGSFDLDDTGSTKDKGGKKKKGKGKVSKGINPYSRDVDNDDDDDDSIDRGRRNSSDLELAKEFAKTIGSRKGDIKFTAHERFIDMEGKYTFVVAVDPTNPEKSWRFLAVDPSSGKEIKGFKDKYKELYPRKKDCRMRFDLAKKRATDLNSARSYKLVFDS